MAYLIELFHHNILFSDRKLETPSVYICMLIVFFSIVRLWS